MATTTTQEEYFTIIVEHQMQESFRIFDQLRKERKLCDVTIVVKDMEISAHKLVLASTSPYFYSMFTHFEYSKQNKIELDVNPQVLLSIVNYMYTCKLTVSEKNIKEVIEISQMLLLHNIQAECCKMLKRTMRLNNCLEIKMMATVLEDIELLDSSTSFIDSHFVDITAREEFLNLTSDQVSELISRDSIGISSEERVYESIVRWISHNPKGRRKYLRYLMGHVRLSFIPKSYLKQYIAKDPFLRGDAYCKDLIIDAFIEDNTITSQKTKPRKYWRDVKMLAIGGYGSEASNTLEYYNFKNECWSQVVKMPFSIYNTGVVAVNQKVYVIGGYRNANNVSTVSNYDIATNSWNEIRSMQLQRSGHAVVVLDNNIYIIGGWDGTRCIDSAEKFDITTQTWTPIAPMFTKRSSPGTCVHNGIIYVVGGWDGNSRLKSVECYDQHTNSWRKLANMHECRGRVGVCALDGQIYAIGGLNRVDPLKTVEMYDPDMDNWTKVASMNVARSWAGVAVVKDKIYVVGGEGLLVTPLKTVEVYDKNTNTWTIFPKPMNVTRSNHAVAIVRWP